MEIFFPKILTKQLNNIKKHEIKIVPNSLFNLGLTYFEGKYIARDVNKGIHYFQRATELNNVNSLFDLAHIFYKGKFVKKDVNKAIQYYSLAAEQGNEIAQIILGEFYLKGEVVNFDINQYFILPKQPIKITLMLKDTLELFI